MLKKLWESIGQTTSIALWATVGFWLGAHVGLMGNDAWKADMALALRVFPYEYDPLARAAVSFFLVVCLPLIGAAIAGFAGFGFSNIVAGSIEHKWNRAFEPVKSDLPILETVRLTLMLYLKTVEVVGVESAALAPRAKMILDSLPTLAREYFILETGYSTTAVDIKKKMFEGEMLAVKSRLQEISTLFSDETLRLNKVLEAKEVSQAEVVVSGLHVSGGLEEHLEEVRLLSSGLNTVEEITPQGADSLARTIDNLQPAEVIRLDHAGNLAWSRRSSSE